MRVERYPNGNQVCKYWVREDDRGTSVITTVSCLCVFCNLEYHCAEEHTRGGESHIIRLVNSVQDLIASCRCRDNHVPVAYTPEEREERLGISTNPGSMTFVSTPTGQSSFANTWREESEAIDGDANFTISASYLPEESSSVLTLEDIERARALLNRPTLSNETYQGVAERLNEASENMTQAETISASSQELADYVRNRDAERAANPPITMTATEVMAREEEARGRSRGVSTDWSRWSRNFSRHVDDEIVRETLGEQIIRQSEEQESERPGMSPDTPNDGR